MRTQELQGKVLPAESVARDLPDPPVNPNDPLRNLQSSCSQDRPDPAPSCGLRWRGAHNGELGKEMSEATTYGPIHYHKHMYKLNTHLCSN